MEKEQTIAENMKTFDDAHTIKQIILIGIDGITRNIELDFLPEDGK